MAPASSSSRFVSVNLNKSYGQPSAGISSPSSNSLQGINRSRSSTHGMVVLTRTRSQPLQQTTSSVASISSRVSKLAVPRPVNLPSLRRENAGNDPTISLVGGSGLSGWTKQQASPQSVDVIPGQSVAPGESLTARSTALTPESTWGASVSHGRGGHAIESGPQNADGRGVPYQAASGRSAAYTPPGSRNTRANGTTSQGQSAPLVVEKAVVFRGEDFPSLQATAPSPSALPEQRQRDLQQKQRHKQNELREQQKKMQQLSQQQYSKEDVNHLEDHSGPHFQPAQPMRSQGKATYPSKDGIRMLSEQSNGTPARANSILQGPSPLIRLTHTSNWADDERETLYSFPVQGSGQSVGAEPGRPQSGYYSMDDWMVDHVGGADFLRPLSRNGSMPGLGKDGGVRNGFKGHYGTEGDFDNGAVKENYVDRVELDSRDSAGKWSGGFGRNDTLRRGWSFPAKESNFNKDVNIGNSSRSSSFNRDSHLNRDNGHIRDISARASRDGDTTSRVNSLDWEIKREVPPRETLRQDGSYMKDSIYSKRGPDGGRGWQGDKVGRNDGNTYQYNGPDGHSHRTVRPGIRSRQDSAGFDYGRDKRTNSFYSQSLMDDPFLGDVINPRTPFNSLDSFMGTVGLEAKAARRRRDEAKVNEFRDTARESFEAELERVQKLQEQERQKMLEERELALERARKEQEERERLAREEEELRLKLEQEAREAAAKAQREAEEAARKVEEERKAREEEKRKIALEEERRKEAARKKLLELEERIAKRESERKREEALKDDGGLMVRPIIEKESVRRNSNLDLEDYDRYNSYVNSKQEDDERPVLRSSLAIQSAVAGKDSVEVPSARTKILDPALQSPDFRGGHPSPLPRTRIAWRKDNLDNGHGSLSASTKSAFQNDFPYLEREQEHRGFSVRDSNRGASRSSFTTHPHERVQSEPAARKDQAGLIQEQQWLSKEDRNLPTTFIPADADSGYAEMDERDADGWWGRDSRHRLQEGQRLRSPPVPSYFNGSEASDYPSVGRLRQSLPKQPRVLPPPPPGQATVHRHAFLPVDVKDVPTDDAMDIVETGPKTGDDLNQSNLDESEEEGDAENVLIEMQLTKPVLSEAEEQSHLQEGQEALDEGDVFCDDCKSEPDEGTSSQTAPEEFSLGVEDEVLDSQRPAEREGAEKQPYTESQDLQTDEPADIDGEALAQSKENELRGALDKHDTVQEHVEGTFETVEQDSVSPKVANELDSGHNSETDCKLEEDSEEKVSHVGTFGGCTSEDPEKPPQVLAEGSAGSASEGEQEAQTGSKDPSMQIVAQDQAIQPFIQPTSYLSVNAMDTVQMGHSEALSSRQSVVQQFQQPFSFMAVPIPQSTSSNSVPAHPSILASMHGIQNQQELPFHLQLGLVPGAPLMPNAIQIGSIQMPLHIHPQIPQLAHLHGQQPPVFQFGQISHPVPLSQPLPIVQQPGQLHPAIGQPVIPPHHQSQAEPHNVAEISKSLPENGHTVMSGDVAGGQNTGTLSGDHKISSDRLADGGSFSRNGNKGEALVEQIHQSSAESNQEYLSDVRASKHALTDQKEKSSGHELGALSAQRTGSKSNQADQSILARPGSRLSSGKRRPSGPWTYGGLGRGRGRFHPGRVGGFESPHHTGERLWLEDGSDGASRNRMFRRNFRRAEYRVRGSVQAFDRKIPTVVSNEEHQPTAEASQVSGLSASDKPGSKDTRLVRDTQMEIGTSARANIASSDSAKNFGESAPCPVQSEAKGDHSDVQASSVKNGLANHSRSKGIHKKYKPDSTGDAPLQSGVVCVFEQPGIETRNDKDDFIEVRSKRQMLREHREQREKENKAKSKEFKVKEQVSRKQRRVSGKAGLQNEMVASLSSKNGLEKRSAFSAESGYSEGQLGMKSHSSGFGSNLLHTSASGMTQVLPPIGTPADISLDRMSKSLKSGQAHSTSGNTFMESGKLAISVHDNLSSVPDSSLCTTAAWGGQRSTHEVVSLTQIQLEEAMKPLRFEGPSSVSERVVTPLEPGLTLPSAVGIEKGASSTRLGLEKAGGPVKGPVSMAGPVSSLLAGEKIQFGAVTSPTLISPSSHPPSPSPIARIGSPLGFRSEMSHIYNHSRNFSGSGGDTTFTSEGNHARVEDDGQMVDPEAEAEAEAAASAVAVAAISNDDLVGNRTTTRTGVLGGSTGASFDSIAKFAGASDTASSIIQTSNTAPGIDDPMSVALPADLSVETTVPLMQGPSTSVPASSGLLLQSLPGGPSPFPCLEMGTMLGGPIFTFGPHEDAPMTSLDPGLTSMGAGGITGWQQRHSGTPDSFYGAPPSGYTGPFVSPTGLSNIQGHPHMLVYANPFTPVGQFGQLGVSFMGTTYHPSGKQPDWKHTPLPNVSQGTLGLIDGGMNVGLMSSQHSNAVSNSVQPGPSVLPVAAPLGLFDTSLSAPFQMTNAEGSVQTHWSKAPAPPLSNLPILGPAPVLSMQPRHSSTLASHLEHLPQLMDVSSSFHQLPVSKPAVSSSFSAVDAAAQFPDELGLGDSATMNRSGLERMSGTGHSGVASLTESPSSSGTKPQRARRIMRNTRGLNGSTGNSTDLALGIHAQTVGSRPEPSLLQPPNLSQQGSLVNEAGSQYNDQKVSQQGLVRSHVGAEWSASNSRKGAPGRSPTIDRSSAGERGPASSSKLKQVYVAKPTGTSQKMGATCS